MKGLVCRCGAPLNKVIETRAREGVIVRRRECPNGHRMTTEEHKLGATHKRHKIANRVHELLAQGHSVKDVALLLDCSPDTVYRIKDEQLPKRQYRESRTPRKPERKQSWNRTSTRAESKPKSPPSPHSKTKWSPEP